MENYHTTSLIFHTHEKRSLDLSDNEKLTSEKSQLEHSTVQKRVYKLPKKFRKKIQHEN